MYMAILDEFDQIIRPELQSQYDSKGKTELLSTSKYHSRTPGLLKPKFQGTRMVARKCYYTEDTKSMSFAKPKISCKGVRKNRIQCLGLDISGPLMEV